MLNAFKKLFNIGKGISNDFTDSAVVANAGAVGRQLIRETDEKLEKAREQINKISIKVNLILEDINQTDAEILKYTDAAKRHNEKGDSAKAIQCAEKVQELRSELKQYKDNLESAEKDKITLENLYDKAVTHRNEQEQNLKNMAAELDIANAVQSVGKLVTDVTSNNSNSAVGVLKEASRNATAASQATLQQLEKDNGNDLLAVDTPEQLTGQAALDAILNK